MRVTGSIRLLAGVLTLLGGQLVSEVTPLNVVVEQTIFAPTFSTLRSTQGLAG